MNKWNIFDVLFIFGGLSFIVLSEYFDFPHDIMIVFYVAVFVALTFRLLNRMKKK